VSNRSRFFTARPASRAAVTAFQKMAGEFFKTDFLA
jgi:hypothetical protein